MPFIYLDIETDNSNNQGLNPRKSKVVTVQLMTEGHKPVIITEPDNLEDFREVLENWIVVGHNIKFEAKFLKYHYGITLKNVYDTMIAEQAIYGGLLSQSEDPRKFKNYAGKGLKDLVYRYCNVKMDKTEQTGFKSGCELTEAQKKYAVDDIVYLPSIMKAQQSKIKMLGLEDIIDIEMKCIPATAWMELSGIYVDAEKFNRIKEVINKKFVNAEKYLQKKLVVYEKQISLDGKHIAKPLNLKSPKQVQEALKAKGYDVAKTDKKARSKYAKDPIFRMLGQYKKFETLIKMFINPLPEHIDEKTGRVYSDFDQYGAATGRFTCGKPNLQQQPSRFTDWRKIFIAEPGNKIVAADYSQIELRIAGQLAQDPKYIDAYTHKKDLHKGTAAVMFNVPLEQVTKTQRSVAKSVNFGLNYGMGKITLKDRLKLDTGQDYTEEQTAKFIDDFRNLYPDVTNYLNQASIEGFKRLEIRTMAGRLFRFEKPSSTKEDRNERKKDIEIQEGNIKRQCKNMPIQGLCADMLKTAMGKIFLQLEPKGVKLVNCVHDELVFECKESQVEEVSEIIKREMEAAGSKYLTDLPCISEVTVSDYWKKD